MSITDLAPWNWGKKNVPMKHDKDEDPFRELQRRMNRVFDDFWGDFGLSPMRMSPLSNWGSFAPSIDLKENDKEIEVRAELPGMSDDDIKVELTNDMLIIKGEKRKEQKKEKDGAQYSECSYGSFHRAIPLPCEVEDDNVKAAFKKGVLTITLPKTAKASAERKKIEVKHG